MISSELIGFVSLIRELAGRKAELDKAYFDNFIQPTWDVFLKIHQAYKSAFTQYIVTASKDQVQLESLLETIRQDYIFNSDLRSELSKLIKNFPTTRFKIKEDYLNKFTEAIVNYFDLRESLNMSFAKSFLTDSNNYESNKQTEDLGRANFLALKQAFALAYMKVAMDYGISDKQGVKKSLESIFEELQFRFDAVAESYYTLRKELLS